MKTERFRKTKKNLSRYSFGDGHLERAYFQNRFQQISRINRQSIVESVWKTRGRAMTARTVEIRIIIG